MRVRLALALFAAAVAAAAGVAVEVGSSSGWKALRLGSPRADTRASAHGFVSDVRAVIHRYPMLLAFYVGTRDTRFRAENVRLDRELTQARIAHVFRVYGGGHSPELWQREAEAWLALAVRHLEPATKG